MRYEQIREVPESQDPSITIETPNLVAKVIDNTGLTLARNAGSTSAWADVYGMHRPLPFSRPLGYHGIRTLYDKRERRNVVAPMAVWLNLQSFSLAGIENDPVDERSWAGVPRGWPIRLEQIKDGGARLVLDPLPHTQCKYTIEFRGGGDEAPDAIDFSVRFVFGKRPASGPARFEATWPCYMAGFDDVRFNYPKGKSPDSWQWTSLGEMPDYILGEPIGYNHKPTVSNAVDQALPVGYGMVGGGRALTIMFSDPRVQFYVVNVGGHMFYSPVQNPAWDFRFVVEDYPLHEPVGFDGRLIYLKFPSPDEVMSRYQSWLKQRISPLPLGEGKQSAALRG